MKTKIKIETIKLILIGILLILSSSCHNKEDEPSGIKDKDGNIYTTVTIGTQIWMVENLKTTKLNDGTDIPLVTDRIAWNNLTTPGYCWCNNEIANKTPYGALYNLYAVNTDKLCPTGWHVPTDEEWHQLLLYFDPDADMSVQEESKIAGIMLKEKGNRHWKENSLCTPATNESGFTALPAGYREGEFYVFGTCCYFWSFIETPVERYISAYDDVVGRFVSRAQIGASVRCLKD